MGWRDYITIKRLVTALVVVACGVVCGTMAYTALSTIFVHKEADAWSIMLLELENSAQRLRQDLDAQLAAGVTEASRYELDESGTLRRLEGDLPQALGVRDLGVEQLSFESRWSLYAMSGEVIALRRLPGQGQNIVAAVRVKVERISGAGTGAQKTTVYLANRDGQLLYANASSVVPDRLLSRPLVMKFIATPLQVGQLVFDTPESKQRRYGFFREIPETNAVLFAEAEVKTLLRSVYDLGLRMSLAFGGILLAAVAGLQIPLVLLTRPLATLARAAQRVGQGELGIEVAAAGVGELRHLSTAFGNMIQGLRLRDLRIQALMEEQKEKIRLEQEVDIAQTIQENLLPPIKAASPEALRFGAVYLPADKVAGDWYGLKSDGDTGETVLAVADVSGHGVGASMFTAIIAALFDDYWMRRVGGFPMLDFVKGVNAALINLGHAKWHCTMAVARCTRGEGVIEIANCGHPFPLLLDPSSTRKPCRQIPASGDALGLQHAFHLEVERCPFPLGSTLLLYTDGLTEATGPDARPYSVRSLMRSVVAAKEGSLPLDLVSHVVQDWRKFLASSRPADDASLIALRSV